MSEPTVGKGRCLCGKVRVTASTMSNQIGACHCRMCRLWAGGPLLAIDCGTNVSFEGQEYIAVFDSSDWAERGFCKSCGSHLFFRLKENHQYFMPVGIFEDDEKFVFHHQIFIDEKPKYYCFSNQTRDMTGAEFFAQYHS
jgi:hypothetical protein